MRPVIFLAATFLFLNCHNAGKIKAKEEKSKIADFLTVSLKTKLAEDDILEVYYSESVQAPYNNQDKLSLYVKGDSLIQNIVFRLPDRIYPMKLRIDLGSKRHETPIQLEEIVLTTGGNSRVFKFEEIKTNFRKNQYLEIDPESNGYVRKLINGVYDPFILSGDLTKITVALFSEN